MTVIKSEFPPMPQRPSFPWVAKLSAIEVEEYEKQRSDAISAATDRYMESFHQVPGFDQVPEESLMYMSTRLALGLQAIFEQGIQIGVDNEQARTEPELSRLRLGEIERLGGWG